MGKQLLINTMFFLNGGEHDMIEIYGQVGCLPKQIAYVKSKSD